MCYVKRRYTKSQKNITIHPVKPGSNDIKALRSWSSRFERVVAARRRIKNQSALPSLTTLHAVRRWCSADGSPIHEQTKWGRVGEDLEPGGSGQLAVKSESRDVTAWLREASRRKRICFSTVRAALCSNIHQEAFLGNAVVKQT